MFDGINRYYLRQEDVGLLPQLAAPVNYLDTYTRYELVHHGLLLTKAQAEIDELRRRLGEAGIELPPSQ